jgi:hypothetical protein
MLRVAMMTPDLTAKLLDSSRSAEHPPRMRACASGRCPHMVFERVLGAERVAALLAYVEARRGDFRPAIVHNRQSGQSRLDPGLRNCLHLADVGEFKHDMRAVVQSIASTALAALRLGEAAVVPREFDLAAYRDGDHFGNHIDTDERGVYYFAATPRRFNGGELRLHGFPKRSAGPEIEPAPHVDIAPETDTLVAFPAWLPHEVLPVRVPSGAWADGRFTFNCWLHRAPSSAG